MNCSVSYLGVRPFYGVTSIRAERLGPSNATAERRPGLDGSGSNGIESSIRTCTGKTVINKLFLRRATAGLRTLAAQPLVDALRLAAIGFCQGGITVLELARANAPIFAAIGFHPGYVRPNGSQDGPIAAKVLMMSGTEDPYASREDFAAFSIEMAAKARDWQLHLFGGVGHTFTDPAIGTFGLPGVACHAAADRMSCTMMRTLLEICFEVRSTDHTADGSSVELERSRLHD